MKTILPVPLLLLLGALTALGAPQHKELKPYPTAEKGRERHVIVLPEKARGEDEGFKVELIVGRVMETDGVNRVRLGGEIKTGVVKGWGYSYYEVENLGPAASTRIGVPPGAPKVTRFVGGPSLMIRYNSRLPVVVYTPAGCEVRYRIWKAGAEETAEQG